MSHRHFTDDHGNNPNDGGRGFVNHLTEFIGETVTVFTTSGGQSGRGFTGILLAVNPCFIRILTQIASAPGCALGNSCIPGYQAGAYNQYGNNNYGCGGYQGYNYNNNLGSVTDIPIDRIASFVHNAV